MASYSVAKRPDGRWRARYRGPDHKERSRHFDRKVDAERWARAEVARIDRGDWTDPARGRLTVGEYSQEWLKGKVRIRPSTRLMYDVVLRNQVLPTWAHTRLDAVRHEDISLWIARLHRDGLSAARTRHAWVVLSQVLELAVRSRRIPNNQAKGVELPALPSKSERDKTRFLNEREVWALAEAAGDHALSVLVLAWCGLRFGELAALRCGSLDLEKRELRVSGTLSEHGGKLVEGPPKTESSIRTVPVPAWLCDELATLTSGRGPDTYLFTASKGGPLRSGNWRYRAFDPAVKKAGLASQQRGDMLRPHDLRHTCASLHIRHGTPPKVLSTMLGHASVAITLDRYGHLYPGDVHLYVDRLGEVALAARADYLRTSGILTPPTGTGEEAENASDLRKQ
jgi:integrase